MLFEDEKHNGPDKRGQAGGRSLPEFLDKRKQAGGRSLPEFLDKREQTGEPPEQQICLWRASRAAILLHLAVSVDS